MKKLLGRILAVIMLVMCNYLPIKINSIEVFATTEWPSSVSVESDGAVLMDADSGVVLFGKNIHTKYFPASITKILTALLVIENCDLNEQITFSHNAVHNVENGSSNAGFEVGDTITVRDALYALLLKSANEAANALAEHCAGSIEAFAELMNKKAKSLGCTESHFVNPSGLNDPNHYVTAYDYALISREAFKNPIFVEIDSTTFYDLPASKNYPEGQTIYTHHAMLKRSNAAYYPGIICGKTGYTTLAGNTLVTYAERDKLKVITVILNGHMTHYSDTKALLDFAFANFKNVLISEVDNSFSDIMSNVDLVSETAKGSILEVDDSRSISLPKDSDISETNRLVNYELNASDPSNAIARLEYTFGDRNVGHTYLLSKYGNTNKAAQEDAVVLVGESSDTQAQATSESTTENKESSESVEESIFVDDSVKNNEETSINTPIKAVGVTLMNITNLKNKFPVIFYAIIVILGIFVLLLMLKLAIFLYDKYEARLIRKKRAERRKANLTGKALVTDIRDLDIASDDTEKMKWL